MTSLYHDAIEFFKILPLCHCHEFEARWTAVDKDLSKFGQYSLDLGLSMNFFFEFNHSQIESQYVRKIGSGGEWSPNLITSAA